MSTGSNEVSFLPSKPVPNSICGTVQEPKSPIDPAAAVEDAAAAVAVAAAVSAAEAVAAAAATDATELEVQAISGRLGSFLRDEVERGFVDFALGFFGDGDEDDGEDDDEDEDGDDEEV